MVNTTDSCAVPNLQEFLPVSVDDESQVVLQTELKYQKYLWLSYYTRNEK